jgi:putative chitinase
VIVAFLNRLGLLRPATAAGGDSHPAAHHFGNATKMVTSTPRLISPITIGLLEALGVRHALAVQYAPLLAIAAHRYQIDASPRRIAAWLATIAHESARLTKTVENLNYSAQGLAQTWPSRYADMTGAPNATAIRIARRQEDIANLTYAGRLGNGSARSGDGWRYRGRGLIQITGRSNYAASGLALGLDLLERPEQLEQPYTAALSAAEWWHRHGCNALADTGDLAAVTRKVNGGLTGLDDRLKLYAAAMAYLGSA